MFNRSFQIRASRGAMVSAGDVLEELVERAGERQRFYRPRRRASPGAKTNRGEKRQAVQLELFPLYDLLPEAYEA